MMARAVANIEEEMTKKNVCKVLQAEGIEDTLNKFFEEGYTLHTIVPHEKKVSGGVESYLVVLKVANS